MRRTWVAMGLLQHLIQTRSPQLFSAGASGSPNREGRGAAQEQCWADLLGLV